MNARVSQIVPYYSLKTKDMRKSPTAAQTRIGIFSYNTLFLDLNPKTRHVYLQLKIHGAEGWVLLCYVTSKV